ncbi:hypothetical protein KRR55_04925 [Paeniglutamicibacter sp. ABSL32-1]|uniref:hypothetical protein n=1 Tax=Paeniglutamicibacter quisquiliarum TaxID=2849498 RepID=UPI001C2D7611|nr:hypothetical protein [Paeniglutamicibacter quisquiliarum]MBV1778459.1 hypothetical protein [Paeniglutamicibacter quisquiliarum]
MKQGKSVVLAAGLLAVFITVVLAVVKPGAACPAVAYVDVGDVEIEFAAEPYSVAACFGIECSPQPVARSAEGKWAVPQSPPYLPPEPGARGGEIRGHVTTLRVVATGSSGLAVDRSNAIWSESTGAFRFWTVCPGPTRYLPVQVP